MKELLIPSRSDQSLSAIQLGKKVQEWRRKRTVQRQAAKLYAIATLHGGRVYDDDRWHVAASERLGEGSGESARHIRVSNQLRFGHPLNELDVTLSYDGAQGDLLSIRAESSMIVEDPSGASGRRFQTGRYDSEGKTEGLPLKTVAKTLKQAAHATGQVPVAIATLVT